MKTDLFQSVATAEFSKFTGILSAALSHHHISSFKYLIGKVLMFSSPALDHEAFEAEPESFLALCPQHLEGAKSMVSSVNIGWMGEMTG